MTRRAGILGGSALALVVGATAVAPTYRSPDSLHYLDVAASLRAGLGPVSFLLHLDSPGAPAPTGLWPDGYPAAVSFLFLMGLDAATAPGVLNAGALLLLALALWALARLAGLPTWLALLAVAAAGGHPAVRLVLTHAWSEPLFVALTTAALALLARGLATRQARLLLAAGAVAGLACAVRFAGLFLVGYLLAATLAWGRAERWSGRSLLLHAAMLGAGPGLIAPLALASNVRAYGRPLGLPRLAAPDLTQALADRSRELLAALDSVPGGWGTALLAIGLLAAAMSARTGAGRAEEAARSAPSLRRRIAILLLGWFPWYLAALLASVAGIVTDPIDLRLLAPAIPPLMLAAFLAAAPRLDGLRRGQLLAGAALALALAGHVDGAARRWLDPPALETAPELVAWANRHASPTTLFVASRGWELRSVAGATVLEDGYPDMVPLAPGPVFRFLAGPGLSFRRVALVFDSRGSMPPERAADFLAEAERSGWAVEPTDERTLAVAELVRRR